MSYENPITETYGEALGSPLVSASSTMTVISPKGCVGFVRDLIAEVTTSIAATTAVPELTVGTASADFTYGRHRLGTSASAGYNTGVHRASQKAWTGNPPRTLSDFAGHVSLETARIPADTAITLTITAGTGGTVAGVVRARFVIDWIGGPVA
jgi:hypothetical protein